ncbi:MAG: hypothetical protein ACLR4Z_03690 [Butyricicoccaceae bacterium]
MDFLSVEQSVWRRLQEETRPIVLYGMGDGADKILAQFDRLGIRAIRGVFASDEFARGNLFHGFCGAQAVGHGSRAGRGHCDHHRVRQPAARGARERCMRSRTDYDVVAPDVPVVPGTAV